MHLYLPPLSLNLSSIRFGASIDMTWLQPGDRASSYILSRDSVWAPRLRFTFGSRLVELADTFLMLTVSPFSVFDGSGYYSIGSIDIAFRERSHAVSWGIGLCEFMYFIH
jgi:hypothetical protein